MKIRHQLATTLAIWSICLFSQAQTLPVGTYLLPASPSSMDVIKLSLGDTTCSGINRYTGNPYRVSMEQNKITVTLGERLNLGAPLCPAPPAPRETIELGRLPPGAYSVTVNFSPSTAGSAPVPLFSNYSFVVTDARATKVAPYVRLDYSGHWWDPNDPGWGLFIWHDANDNVLAAWFTYGTDGKPIWYTFQPRWRTSTATLSADMYQTSRMPGPTVPPPNPTTLTMVGSASLDFTYVDGVFAPTANQAAGDQGMFTYTFGAGQTLVRNIQRFRP